MDQRGTKRTPAGEPLPAPGPLTAGTALEHIADCAFKLTGVLSVDLSHRDRLGSIGGCAFAQCTEFRWVSLAGCKALRSLGDLAVRVPAAGEPAGVDGRSFERCTSLACVDLSNCSSLQSIGTSSFDTCSALTSVNLGGCLELERIRPRAFFNCGSLVAIELPGAAGGSPVRRIGNAAFYQTALRAFRLPRSALRSIGREAFRGCRALLVLDLSGSAELRVVGEDAFSGCSALRAVNLSRCTALERIDPRAFSGCGSLASFNVGGCGALRVLGAGALQRTALVALDLSDCTALACIGSCALFECSALEAPDVSDCVSLLEIGDHALCGCTALGALDLSACTTLRLIGKCAGYGCRALTSVRLPAVGWTAAALAFAECAALRDVDFTGGAQRLATLRCISVATHSARAVEARVPAGLVLGPDAFKGCVALTRMGVRGYGWTRVRTIVFLRGFALHWQEVVAQALCAPGGAWEAQDRAAFEADADGHWAAA